MLKKLNGKVIEINNNFIIFDVNNLGFEVFVSNPKFYILNQNYEIYVYDYLNENNISLFGFNNYTEYEYFLLIISLNGYGPKKALNILKNIDPLNFKDLILKKDIDSLRKISGISSNAEIFVSKLYPKFSKKYLNDKVIKNTYETLIKLGYSDNNIKKILLENTCINNEKELIEFSIKRLNKNGI